MLTTTNMTSPATKSKTAILIPNTHINQIPFSPVVDKACSCLGLNYPLSIPYTK